MQDGHSLLHVYEKFSFKFSQNLLAEEGLINVLRDNHYKTIYGFTNQSEVSAWSLGTESDVKIGNLNVIARKTTNCTKSGAH